MIIDNIKHSSKYDVLGAHIAAALDYLRTQDFLHLALGRYNILGDDCFAIVQDYETVPREKKRWEAHRKYIDIQYVASGTESIGVANIDELRVAENYSESADIVWLEGNGDLLTAPAGTFMILFPNDAHIPGVAVAEPSPIRKVVVKVAVSTLNDNGG
jgi:YhcH/YjgK/YiaL family protein